MMPEIKLPKKFLIVHSDRDLPTPAILRETSKYFVVDSDDPALPELIDDANYYADGVDQAPHVRNAAIALLAAYHKHLFPA